MMTNDISELIAGLSSEKRALLELRLKNNGSARNSFPSRSRRRDYGPSNNWTSTSRSITRRMPCFSEGLSMFRH